jgi:NADH-quinone oxidoreductase subunit N
MPPLIGFFGKLYLFTSAITVGFTGLVIIAALNSVISLYYYLRVIVVMYFSESDSSESDALDDDSNLFPSIAIAASTACVVMLGIYSQPLLDAVNKAFQ